MLRDSNQETVHTKYTKHLRKNNLTSLNAKTRCKSGFYNFVESAGRLSNQLKAFFKRIQLQQSHPIFLN
ncbi:hypothetical protein GGD38_005634 [Chitinophagaceae bacterium OAS944]|nr:hypothetical protein [Chitinophagaceae bacterium OAS944]